MAIVDNFYLRNQRKKLGGAVYYKAMGQTRSRELAAEVSNPRTTSQMTQRVKWANLVNLYRANKRWMKFAFETKKANQSDYNKFMSLNVAGSNIFLTKEIAAAGGCIVQSYIITQGSLPSIECFYNTQDQRWNTNLYLGDGDTITGKTVAEVAQMLLANNPALHEGDQLSFVRMTQMTNSYNGAPYVIVREYEVILSLQNNRPFADYMPDEYIGESGDTGNNCIVVINSGYAGGFALVLSRTTGGRTYVSTQPIIVANNSALIAAYSSGGALQAAIESYGESSEPFLTSTVANPTEEILTPNSIISLVANTNRIVPGSFFQLTKSLATKNMAIMFAQQVSGTVASVRLSYMSGGNIGATVLTSPSASGSLVSGTLGQADALPEDAAVSSVIISMENGDVYEAAFIVPNSYTIGGLE